MERKKPAKRQAGRQAGSGERPKAATRDVLAPARANIKINPKWIENYRHLKELQGHFQRQSGKLAEAASEEQPSFSEHMADAGTDSYDRDFALSMLSSDQSALYEIEQAIRRIETGVYGICEATGKPIQRKRLNAIPWTRFSIAAEQQLEERGAFNRARLGSLGSITEMSPRTDLQEKETPENNASTEE